MTNISLDELTNLLQEKLELKRKVVELEKKYIQTLANYLKSNAYVWTYQFDINTPITLENLDEFLGYTIKESKDYSKSDLLKAVQLLYEQKFNKR